MAKKIVSYILVFVIIIALLASIILGTLSLTILNEKFALNILSKNAYYSKMYNEIIETFKNNTIQSGLSDEVLEGIISQDKVKSDINMVVSYLYGSSDKIDIDLESVRIKLQKNIDRQIEENNKVTNEEELEAIDKYINTITDIYSNGIIYSNKYVEQAQKVIKKANGIINKLSILAFAITVFLVLILIAINGKRVCKYLAISFFATGFLLMLIKAFEVSAMKINSVLILNKAFSEFAISLIEYTILSLLVCGIILCIIALILSTKYKKRKYTMH